MRSKLRFSLVQILCRIESDLHHLGKGGFALLGGREFAVLCPVDIEDGAEVGLVIMESVNGDSLEFVSDEAITNTVFDAFMESFGEE